MRRYDCFQEIASHDDTARAGDEEQLTGLVSLQDEIDQAMHTLQQSLMTVAASSVKVRSIACWDVTMNRHLTQ